MYHWDASEYRDSSSNQKRWAMELLRRLELEGAERLLDIGCGDGEITAEIARRVPRGSVLGVDSSRDMVELASRQYPADRYPNLAFLLKDARELDFAEEFDAVFSNACLHWVKDHQPVLDGIRRCLKPGGRVLLQMGGRGNAATVLAALELVLESPRWTDYFAGFSFPYAFYGPGEYRPWLESRGFSISRLELVPKEMAHRGGGDFVAWLRTTWLPYTERVPDGLREDFIRQIVAAHALVKPPYADGSIHFEMVRLEVDARKGE